MLSDSSTPSRTCSYHLLRCHVTVCTRFGVCCTHIERDDVLFPPFFPHSTQRRDILLINVRLNSICSRWLFLSCCNQMFSFFLEVSFLILLYFTSLLLSHVVLTFDNHWPRVFSIPSSFAGSFFRIQLRTVGNNFRRVLMGLLHKRRSYRAKSLVLGQKISLLFGCPVQTRVELR